MKPKMNRCDGPMKRSSVKEKLRVTFVNEDDISCFIRADATGTTFATRKTLHDIQENDNDDDTFHLWETDDSFTKKATSLLDDDTTEVMGSEVFAFRKKSRRKSLLQVVDAARTDEVALRSPKSTQSQTPITPNSKGKQKSKMKTPISARKVKRKLIILDDTSSSKYEVSESESSESDFSDNQIETPKSKHSVVKRTPLKTAANGTNGLTPLRRSTRKRAEAELVSSAEEVGEAGDYFQHNGDIGKVITSDHTLSRLETPRLAPDALRSLLGNIEETHLPGKQMLMDEHRASFSHWMTLMSEGFSLFLYGLGSKKPLISEFQRKYLCEFDHIVVNGFFPSLTLKHILNNITEDILNTHQSFHGLLDQLDHICKWYNEPDADPLFVVIHNLDGSMLRGDRTQTSLSQLASCENVHFVASLDHVNAPLIFDASKLSGYNALWLDATTMSSYCEETAFESSLLVQQSGALALSSLVHVFQSLTPNAKGIFILLSKYQLDQKENKNYQGMPISALFQKCFEAYLVSSDLTLSAHLTEFRDHKLIRSKKAADGIEYLVIPLEDAMLTEFVESQHEN